MKLTATEIIAIIAALTTAIVTIVTAVQGNVPVVPGV